MYKERRIECLLYDAINKIRTTTSFIWLEQCYGMAIAYLTVLEELFNEDTKKLEKEVVSLYRSRYDKLNTFTFELAGTKYEAEENSKAEIEKLLNAFSNGNASKELLKQWTELLVEEKIKPLDEE